ncbi:beta-galactosidase-1-like protein 3 [Diorhabda carinulata]|uniref:beta-galactosidase-1-like protein 3 n=1 Tax=Diorhabda carinulata TaxID=1163345 RepID=UPI0025A203B6|nr:beta-galactosidase-1-like protein 3 [Diorhabda carinulata]
MALSADYSAGLPTNYAFYTTGGIQSGLSVDQPYFTLNDRNISIYSGALHYFRVPRAYWRDRLRKMRAAGLNTVETYIPWNLHEPQSGQFDFGEGNNDMSDFLHLEEFLKTAQEEDLFAIVRSGPFICAEFEFGGFPSWLLRDKELEMRTSNQSYMKYVTRFFNMLLPMLAALQFTYGGPIIMFQVENEYAVSGKKDLEYLKLLRQLMLDNGIKELLVTSDNPVRGAGGTIRSLFFMTGNFNTDAINNLDKLKSYQPDKPLMTMEYWSGWFDFWGRSHSNGTLESFEEVYEQILSYPSSVNIYMFHGGTNFGFLNGAENLKFDDLETDYHSIISSYDYGAPLDESGDYTDKYWAVKELLDKYNAIKTKLPDVPTPPRKIAYPEISIQKQLKIEEILHTISPVYSKNVVAMETIDINNNNGQSFGYIVYRKVLDIPAGAVLKIEGRVCDTVMVLINGQLVSPWISRAVDMNQFGTSRIENSTLTLSTVDVKNATLDLIVENWGRVNVRVYKQYKGLWQGGVLVNDQYITDWLIYPLEFKRSWNYNLNFNDDYDENTVGPVLYRGILNIEGEPEDTYVNMRNWRKGIVIVNGFVIGRYARMGPIQTLYLPAPLLQEGDNSIIVFEHFKPDSKIQFATGHLYESH